MRPNVTERSLQGNTESVRSLPSMLGGMTIDDMLLNMGVIQPHAKRRFSRAVRDRIARLSRYRCAHCGRRVALDADDFVDKMHTGHVVAWSKKGPNSYDNLVCLCARCNHIQGDRSFLETWGLLDAVRLNAQAIVNGILYGFV